MSRPLSLYVAAVLGYVVGALPSAGAAARLSGRGIDPATEGSGNPGALNTTHLLGRRWGVAVTVADIAKGTLAAAIGRRLAGPHGADVAATAAVVGHCHPPGRKGGKGVATSVGQVLGTTPAYLPVDAGVGYLSTRLPWFRHRTRGATGLASALWVATTTLWWRRRWPNPGGSAPTWTLPAGALVSSLVIAERFRAGADGVERERSDSGREEVR